MNHVSKALLEAIVVALAFASVQCAHADGFPRKLAKDIPDCAGAQADAPVCRETTAISAADATDRLKGRNFAYWTEGDHLNIVARSKAQLRLSGTFQESLDAIPAAPGQDLWARIYRLPQLDRALVEMWLKPNPPETGDLMFVGRSGPRPLTATWKLDGRMISLSLPSRYLASGKRRLTIYLPPGDRQRGLPVIFMTDGEETQMYASVLDALIRKGQARPALLVGIWSGLDDPDARTRDLRWEEYVRGQNTDAYDRHRKFVLEEVVPYVARRFGASADPRQRIAFGASNGADWVLATASLDPGAFGHLLAYSPGDSRPFAWSRQGPEVRIEAGQYEPEFLKPARAICTRITDAGGRCALTSYFAGHGEQIWRFQFERDLRAVLGNQHHRSGSVPHRTRPRK